MSDNLIWRTGSAYDYPLLIKNMFAAPLVDAPDQEIVYRGDRRFTYRQFRDRVARLASALVGLGVKPGDTVAVMDWDSHRYLECFFAVPMIGAVLQTVNVRLSPEQILYTINHAEDDVLLVNAEFLPVLEAIRATLETVQDVRADDRRAARRRRRCRFAGEYEALLAAAAPMAEFPDFDENTRATTFYTTGTTGLPKGVYFSHRQLVLHTLARAGDARPATAGPLPPRRRLHAADADVPRPRLGHSLRRDHARRQAGLPGHATCPTCSSGCIATEKVTFSHCVPTILHMLLGATGRGSASTSRGLEGDHRRLGPADGARPGGARARHRRLRRLRHVGDLSGADRHQPVGRRAASCRSRSRRRCACAPGVPIALRRSSRSSTSTATRCRTTTRRAARSSCARRG